MHPKLETPGEFRGFHNGLITLIHFYLAPRLPEPYRATVESSITLAAPPERHATDPT